MSNYKLYKGAWVADDSFNETRLSDDEAKCLLNGGGYFVRNVFDFDCEEKTSFWYVIKDSFGGMEELSSKMRNQVKRCFKTMRVEQISAEYLMANGYEVYVAAAENYRIKAAVPTRKEFETRIKKSVKNEFWGVIDIETEQLVAFSINQVTEDVCNYSTMKAIPKYQKRYAYYGLIFEMNRYYLEVRKVKYVNDGARSITHHSNIQPFLIEKFKFRKAYCHLHLTYKWWFGMVVRVLYPFRRVIKVAKVKAILNMEAMARGEI